MFLNSTVADRSVSPFRRAVSEKDYIRMGVLAVLAVLGATAGCGVRDREVLVGQYVAPATGETWTLDEDGTCRIERTGATLPCEWVYRKGEDGTRLVVTVKGIPGAPESHSRRYVLTPSKWLGQPVTIPLSSTATLQKRD
jgi:hypothetical protein